MRGPGIDDFSYGRIVMRAHGGRDDCCVLARMLPQPRGTGNAGYVIQ
jgi:hypothetical protein